MKQDTKALIIRPISLKEVGPKKDLTLTVTRPLSFQNLGPNLVLKLADCVKTDRQNFNLVFAIHLFCI